MSTWTMMTNQNESHAINFQNRHCVIMNEFASFKDCFGQLCFIEEMCMANIFLIFHFWRKPLNLSDDSHLNNTIVCFWWFSEAINDIFDLEKKKWLPFARYISCCFSRIKSLIYSLIIRSISYFNFKKNKASNYHSKPFVS